MNKQNVKVWKYAGKLKAEWSDRALDDDDRYKKDSIMITVEVDADRGERALWSEMAQAYDQWVRDTRNGD